MAKHPTDEGTQQFHLRKGVDPFGNSGWKGMNTENDPSALAPNELQLGRDVRLQGGSIVNRPGLELVADLANLSGLTGLSGWGDEFPGDNPHHRLWVMVEGCFGVAAGKGVQLLRVDTLEDPQAQVYMSFTSENSYVAPLGSYGDRIMIGNKSLLQEVFQITPPYGVEIGDIMLSPPQLLIRDFGAGDWNINCMMEFDNQLFIGLENLSSPANSKILAWDGLTFTEDLTGIDPPLNFGRWSDKLVVAFDKTVGELQYRDPGSAASWTTVALVGFGVSTVGLNSMVEDHDKLFIADGVDTIYQFDGSVITAARTVAGCASLHALTMHEDILHYGWNKTVSFQAVIGRRDRDSTTLEYVDEYKNLTTDIALFKRITTMQSYRRQIVCGAFATSLAATAGNDVKGTAYSVYAPGAGATTFPIRQILAVPPLFV